MNNISEIKDVCTGCTACSNICPVNAITMIENNEGFREPQIDFEKCVNCGKCLKTCPTLNRKFEKREKQDCYAVYNNELRKKSSSGGVFATLANSFIQDGGYVCGAVYNEDFEVEHIVTNNIEDIQRMQGSKYVQSNLKDCFAEIQELLNNGKKVLFSGTSCQVAGLKSFLKGIKVSEENLFTCDLICYGVPSPKVWRKYLNEMIPKDEKILAINMREKKAKSSYFSIETNKNKYSVPLYSGEFFNIFIDLFFKNIILRKSCAKCLYTNMDRVGDLTLGDFWGIQKYFKKLNPQNGISCVIPNNEKGEKLFKKYKSNFEFCKKLPIKYALKKQPRLKTPTVVPALKRQEFFDNLDKMSLVENYERTVKDKSDCKIINYWFAVNYGASLTCYALKRFIEKQGFSVKTINYVSEKIAHNRRYELSKAKDFAEKYLNLTSKCNNFSDLKNLNNNTDFFVVGSDQVWRNSLYSSHGGNIYQLNFVNDDKLKIAYSASFGCDNFDGDNSEKSLVKYLLKRFNAISVRETRGLDILKNEFKITDAEHILDPVFTLDENDLNDICKDYEGEKYIGSFKYAIQTNAKWCQAFEQKLSDRLNVPVKPLIYDNKCDIEEFVTYIKNCEFLITDSFHAVCFAILFKKPFVILGLADKVLGRMTSLLQTFKLDEKTLIPKEKMKLENVDTQVEELLNLNQDYDKVFEIMQKEKQKAETWFSEIFKKEKPILDEKDEAISALMTQNMILKERVCNAELGISLIINAPRIILSLIFYKFVVKFNKKASPMMHEKLRVFRTYFKQLKRFFKLSDFI